MYITWVQSVTASSEVIAYSSGLFWTIVGLVIFTVGTRKRKGHKKFRAQTTYGCHAVSDEFERSRKSDIMMLCS